MSSTTSETNNKGAGAKITQTTESTKIISHDEIPTNTFDQQQPLEKFSRRPAFKSHGRITKLNTKRAEERSLRALLAHQNTHASQHYAPTTSPPSTSPPSTKTKPPKQRPGNPLPAFLDLHKTCSKQCFKTLKHGSILCRKTETRAPTSLKKDPVCKDCYGLLRKAWDDEGRYLGWRRDVVNSERRWEMGSVSGVDVEEWKVVRDRELEFFDPDGEEADEEDEELESQEDEELDSEDEESCSEEDEEFDSKSDISAEECLSAAISHCPSPTGILPVNSRRSRRHAARQDRSKAHRTISSVDSPESPINTPVEIFDSPISSSFSVHPSNTDAYYPIHSVKETLTKLEEKLEEESQKLHAIKEALVKNEEEYRKKFIERLESILNIANEQDSEEEYQKEFIARLESILDLANEQD
ncbi:MAG: hypothetical protein M1812_002960 [Candelaria pacifica]|nr:MAG: hypothetical protein M1812_002960 [Candelaria pacifica]